MESLQINIETMIDIAIGSPYGGRVNFWALHAVLNSFAKKMDMQNEDIGKYLGYKQRLEIKNRLTGGGDDGEQHTEEPTPSVIKETTEEKSNTSEAPPTVEHEPDIVQPAEVAEETTKKESQYVEKPTGIAFSGEVKGEVAGEAEMPQSEGTKESPNESNLQESTKVIEEVKSKEIIFKEPMTPDQSVPETAPPPPLSASPSRKIEDKPSSAGKLDNFGKESERPTYPFSFGGSALRVARHMDRSTDNLVKTIEKLDQNSEKVKEVLENWNFVLHGIITLAQIVIYNKKDEYTKRMNYLLMKLNPYLVNLNSSETNIDSNEVLREFSIKKSSDITETSEQNQKPTEMNSINEKIMKRTLEDVKMLYSKIDYLTAAFMKINFESGFSKVAELTDRTKNSLSAMAGFEAKIQRANEKIVVLQNTAKDLSDRIVMLDKNKVEVSQIKEIIVGKADFIHLKRKLSIVDFVQYKYMIEYTLCDIDRILNNFASRFSIIEEIREILINIKSANWVNDLQSQFEKDINALRKEIMDIIQEKQVCGTLGIPLVCNMPHSLSAKKDDKCSSEIKKNYYIPSLDEIEKACAKRLAAGNRPFKLPPRDYLYKGLTVNMVKRSPSAPGSLKKICGEKLNGNL